MRRSSLRQASRTGDGAACHEQSLLLYYCQHSGLPSLHQIHPVKCCLQSSRLSLSMSSQIFQIPPPNQFQRFLLNHCHINDPASLVLAVFPHWQNVWAKQCKGGDMYLCALSQKCQSITQNDTVKRILIRNSNIHVNASFVSLLRSGVFCICGITVITVTWEYPAWSLLSAYLTVVLFPENVRLARCLQSSRFPIRDDSLLHTGRAGLCFVLRLNKFRSWFENVWGFLFVLVKAMIGQ